MQLNPAPSHRAEPTKQTQTAAPSSLHLALAAASAALLAPLAGQAQAPSGSTNPGASSAPAAAPTSAAWQVDSAVLFYKESGGRVSAIEPVIGARRTDGNDRSASLRFTLDALTGASPNGAVAQPTPQTFTSPSGESTYVTPAGRLPLDPSFKDTRGALAFGWEQPWGENRRVSLGANISAEYDFKSASLNTAFARDFNEKNTTLSIGAAFEADRIHPVGGAPPGLRPAFVAGAARVNSESRNVVDLLLGVTQTMNRRWVTQLNLGLGRGGGFHTDPYKVLSVVDAGTGLAIGARYVGEKRPDSRTRQSLFWQHKLHLERDVIDASYRYYRDDWGVRAHTLDLRYRYEFGAGMHLEPHARHYRQSEADFWRGWLVEGRDWDSATQTTTLAHASADARLAQLSANTLGAKFGMPARWGGEFSLRVEAYRQTQATPANAPGVLQSLDIAPALTATMLLVGYSLPF
jgi:Protein of unknown function (DUF3570)